MNTPRHSVIWKRIGQTPLEAIEEYRKKSGIDAGIPMAYAGRLDPMAEGKLLVLIGEECKKLKEYTGLDKEYEFEILLGFSSDTGDVLGLAEAGNASAFPDARVLKSVTRQFLGRRSFPYPKFSSKTVRGKPLHTWTLEGRLGEIEIPMKESVIYSLRCIEQTIVSKEALQKKIFEKINSFPPVTDEKKALGRDFRREEIRARWNELFKKTPRSEFLTVRYRCSASSGTYMRTLAEELGRALGSRGLALSIKRTVIGTYSSMLPSFGWWTKRF